MSPKQAIDLVDQVASRFQGNRQDHMNLQMAVSVLNGLVSKAEQEGEKVETEVETLVGKTEEDVAGAAAGLKKK